MNVLFVCSRNKLRSPTAEQVFIDYPGVEVASAGLNHDAATPVDAELVQWADVIFVMEKAHRRRLQTRFRNQLKSARVVCLEIPDRFQYMDPELVKILTERVTGFLP